MVGSVGAALLAAMAKRSASQRPESAQLPEEHTGGATEKTAPLPTKDESPAPPVVLSRAEQRAIAREQAFRQIPVTYAPSNLDSTANPGVEKQAKRERLGLPKKNKEESAPAGKKKGGTSNWPKRGKQNLRFDFERERAPRQGTLGATAPRPVAPVAAPRAEPPPPYELIFGKSAGLPRHAGETGAVALLPSLDVQSSNDQVNGTRKTDEREVNIGLDFGTSCVKVVIGDSALGRAFAVPWVAGSGIARYLLPSRLCDSQGACSLVSGDAVHRDLKLSLIADPHDVERQTKVIAFLALVVRAARNWLLEEHRDIYASTNILWRLTVGLPTAQTLETDITILCRNLGRLAWGLSRLSGDVTLTAAASALRDAPPACDEVEVTVVPEIAAQIYGFVVSTGFDPAAANIFLMADIGSGTVDSALFRVKAARGGRWDFEFFTSIVEPNGVSNLHRHRIDWWTSVLEGDPIGAGLAPALEHTKYATDLGTTCPDSFQRYLHDVQVKINKGGIDPDESFFSLRVVAQVQGRSFWRAWKDGLLPQANLSGVPFFMCGGGSRMALYQQLEAKLQSVQGVTWLSAVPHWLTLPDDLVAAGVHQDDGYDRLSVAYGLSQIDVGKVVRALPMPTLPSETTQSWREHYIDKDQC